MDTPNLYGIRKQHTGLLTYDEAKDMKFTDIIQNCIHTDRRPDSETIMRESSWRTCVFGKALSKRMPEWADRNITNTQRRDVLLRTNERIVRLGTILSLFIATNNYDRALAIAKQLESVAANLSEANLDLIRNMLVRDGLSS